MGSSEYLNFLLSVRISEFLFGDMRFSSAMRTHILEYLWVWDVMFAPKER